VRELRRHVPADGWLEGRCVLENQTTPLRPFADVLSGLDEPFESLLARHGFDPAETVPLFAGLLSQVISARYPPLPYSRERQKELALNALLALLVKMGEAAPRVLVLEDLHWADPTTLELCTLLVQELRSAQVVDGQPLRLCVVFTARPEFEPPWPADDMAIMQLARLDHDEVEEMITAGLAHDRPLPKPTVDAIIRHADGIPLFVEEVTRVLIDADVSRSGGDPIAADALVPIPSTLRDLLTARLDGLSLVVKDTVQLAAVLGREFRYEVLKAVSRKDEAALRDDLSDLTKSGLIFQRRSVRSESYVFKHALVRDTAYESMVRSVRQDLHRRVANTLQQRFPDIEQHRPEVLAQHFEGAGEVERAVEYWQRAGDRALKRVGYVEATQQLERGLTLLHTLPVSRQRSRLEIELLTTLGTVLFSTKGYAAEEVERTFARARELCDQLGEDVSLKVLQGIASVYLSRSDREATSALLPRFRRLAERTDDPLLCITGNAVLAAAALWSGDFIALRDHTTIALGYYRTEEFQRFAEAYGYDGGFFMYPYKMVSLFNLGYPDQAEALRREFMVTAEQSGNPYSLLIALAFATTLTHDRGDTAETLALTDRLTAQATEQRLYFWLAAAMCARGGALMQRGELDDAIAQIQQGLVVYSSLGVLTSYNYYLTYLATAHLAGGYVAEAMRVADEGLALCQRQLARFHEPELLRLKAECLARDGDVTAAEANARRALELARRDSAKAFELRAAMSLSHLLHDTGRRDEARTVLHDTYGWFTEGFATKDLREARALLGELKS